MNIDNLKYMTLGLYAIGVKDTKNDRFCGLIVDALMPFIPSPATIVVSIRNTCYSCEQILKSKQFSVSVLGQNTDPKVFAALGYQTGKNCDKWKDLDYFEQNGLPFLSEAIQIMSAKVIEHYQVDAYTLIVARIENEKILNTDLPLTYAQYQTSLKNKVVEIFNNKKKGKNMKEKWICKVCGYEYDGDVPFEELPEDWTCPLCGVGKDQFEKVEQ